MDFETHVISAIKDPSVIPDGELALLTFKDVVKLLKHFQDIAILPWDDLQTIKKKFIQRYINLDDVAIHEKIQCFFGLTKDVYTNIDLNDLKMQIICHVKDPSIGYTLYKPLMEMIVEGRICFYKDEMLLLPRAFYEEIFGFFKYRHVHCNFLKKNRNKQFDEFEEEAESSRKVTMSNMEMFFVNLAYIAPSLELDELSIMKCYSLECHPKYKAFPMQITRFSGDLLPQIQSHYENKAHLISPIIEIRRNLGLLCQNTAVFPKFYKFHEKMKNPFMTTDLYIEFPYMCYAFVERVEVDVEKKSYIRDDKDRKINYTSGGIEYVFSSFCDPDAQSPDQSNTKQLTETLTLTHTHKKSKTPYTYFSIHLSQYDTVHAVRLYGGAVCFI